MDRAIDRARAGQETLESLRGEVTPQKLLDGDAEAILAHARDDLREAHDASHSWVLTPLRAVPVANRQLASTRALTDAGVTATDAGLITLRAAQEILGGPLPSGEDRVEALRELAGLGREAREVVDGIDLGPVEGLVPHLAEARDGAATGVEEVREALDRAAQGAETLAHVMDGPTRYVFLAANNAEMRAGSGMFLELGVMEINGGRITVSELLEPQDLRLEPGTVPPSGSYATLWSFLEPSREFRNLAATPRFDETGPLTVAMFEAATGLEFDGAIAVDPYLLEALLESTGPIRVDDEVISADTVVRDLLHDQYVGVDVRGSRQENDRRRERLSAINSAAFDALGSGDIDPQVLLGELSDAAARRHVLAWDEDPEVQAGWEALGVAGTYQPESIGVAVLNRGINKLDFYLKTTAKLDVERGASEGGRVPATLEVTVENATPPGQSGYIAGPFPAVEDAQAYGDYVGILAVSLPGFARNATIDGVDQLTVAGPDGPTLAVGTQFVLGQGRSWTATVRFDLPADMEVVHIEPSARVRPQRWFVEGREFWDDRAHTVPLAAADR